MLMFTKFHWLCIINCSVMLYIYAKRHRKGFEILVRHGIKILFKNSVGIIDGKNSTIKISIHL